MKRVLKLINKCAEALTRGCRPEPGKERVSVDPESERIWRELRGLDEEWCCKLMREVMRDGGITKLILRKANGEGATIDINNCPRCGRKLK